jgi:23S rRNA-/tRNA-specific pseudouridylate synthase
LEIILKHIVESEENNIRIVDYILSSISHFPSKKSIKKAIKRQEVRVDGQTTTTAHWIKTGEIIEVLESENVSKNYEINLKIYYEDEQIAVIEKPAGLQVSGNKFKTLSNTLSFNLSKSKASGALKRPLPAHRLDKQTSGIMLIGKTRKAIHALGLMFESQKIKKTYVALVEGVIDVQGEI